MNRPSRYFVRLRLLTSRLGSLLLLFQRSPIVQMILPEAKVIGGAGLGEITMWTVATVAGLGAYDSVAGATTIAQVLPTAGSNSVSATENKNLNFVFQMTGSSHTPASWKVTGIPSGLVHADAKNTSTDSVSGSPTQTGTFSVKVTAYEKSGYSGDSFSKTFTMNVIADPAARIVTHPASVVINSGQTTVLRVTAAGDTPFTYQWYRGSTGNTSVPVGTNSAAFTTPALTSSTSYWVNVSNSANPSGANSNTAIVSVVSPATVVTDPASKTIISGQSTTLSVVASGSTPLNYQWYQGLSGITSTPVGTNSPSFTTPVLTETTLYWVRVTNAANPGGDNSATATITVNTPAAITSQPAAVTINSGQTTTLNVTATGTAPLVYQWYEGASGVTTTPVGTDSPSFTTPVLTADKNYWVKVTNIANTSGALSSTALVSVNQPAVISENPASTSIVSGNPVNLSVNAAGTAPLHYQWYEGASGDTSHPVGLDSADFTSAALSSSTTYWVRVTNVANATGADSATAQVTVNDPVVITQQPLPATLNSGDTATLTATATGTQPITCQWFQGEAGDTSTPVGTDSLQLTTPALTVSTTYWLRLTNVASPQGVASNAVRLTILGDRPATIAAQPQSLTISNGAFTTLSVTAGGLAPFTYQWYQGLSGDTSTPVGTNSASLTTPVLSATTSYWVHVSNLSNPSGVDSETATVTIPVESPAAVVTPPAAALIARGASATLNVFASGTAPLNYQWYQGLKGDISTPVGTNSASLTTPALDADGSFWVRVTNAFNAIGDDSDAALVTVNDPSVITAPPASVSIDYNTSATLQVTAAGTAPLVYQWYRGASGDTSHPVGGNFPSLTTPDLISSTSYWVNVSNAVNPQGVDSAAALVTVVPFVPVQITTQPLPATVNRGETAELALTASGSVAITYQWYQGSAGDTSTPVGTDSPNLTTPEIFTATSFWARVFNGGSTQDSDAVDVTPLSVTDIQQPVGIHLVSGATKNFGNVVVGNSKAQTFTLHNAGSVSLDGIAITKTGAHIGDYQIIPPAHATLAGDASTTFTVAFKPTAAGTHTATLHVQSSLAGEPPFDLKLTGTSQKPVPEISIQQPKGSELIDGKATRSFGTAKLGKSGRAITFYIMSVGTGDLTGIKVSVTGAQKKDFIVAKPAKTIVPAGTSLAFKVTFKPTATGARSATLQVGSNDANENPYDIKLTGQGVP